jgi:molybdate transport system substrate-binding protein
MIARIRRALAAPILLAIAAPVVSQNFPGPKVADAPAGVVRIIATAAIKDPLEAVLPQAEKAIGKRIVAEYGSARGNLKTKILGGQDFEVAILLPDVDADIAAQNKIVPGRHRIGTIDVGIALRGDAPSNLDVSTPGALKATMLNARSVRYSPTGAALDTVRKVLSTLGIADSIKDSSKLATPVALAPGEYEINLYPISEIIPNKALRNLGPVIKELQVPVVLEATVGAHANDPAAARKLIRFLQGPAINPGLKVAGVTKDTTNSR